MTDKTFVTLISALAIYIIDLVKMFMKYSPEITFIVQLFIGVLTIVYLILKIKYVKK